jgi:hypothetical protein
MARRGGNFTPGDDPEINPNPQNLASALAVIGQTARKYVFELVGAYINTDLGIAIFHSFITRGTHVSQGPTVPEHRANIENRLNTSLAYRPYRPYHSFTPHNEDEGHSNRSPHRVSNSIPLSPQLNSASLQSTALAGSSRGHTESLSPPATVSFTPTSNPSIPMASLDTSTALVHPSSPATAQVTTPDTSLNDAPMDDAPVDAAPVDDAPVHHISSGSPFRCHPAAASASSLSAPPVIYSSQISTSDRQV